MGLNENVKNLITSVDETQKPIWTEEHIEEMLNNFVVRWK